MFNIYIPRDTSQVFLFFLIISHFVALTKPKPKPRRKKEEACHTFLLVHKSFEAGLLGLGLSPSWFESVVARGQRVISSLAVGSCRKNPRSPQMYSAVP